MPYKRTGRPSGRPKKTRPDLGDPPKLTEKQWKGLKYEIAHPDASPSMIARAAGVSREAVRQWWKNERYEYGRTWLHSQRAFDFLARKNAETRKKISDEVSKSAADPDTTLELLYWELGGKNNWTGSVVSDFDGQTYTDLEAYIEHLKNWRSDDGGPIAWVGHLPNPRAKK